VANQLRDPAMAAVFGRVVGVRKVDSNRCYLAVARVDAFENIAEYIGDTEVMYLWHNTAGGEPDVREQILVREVDSHWQLTGWQEWEEATSCVYTGNENDPYWAPRCFKHATIHPWALQSELDAQRGMPAKAMAP
jgi:hypothetical protein